MKKLSSLFIYGLLLLLSVHTTAQRSMSVEDLTAWQRITQTKLSDDGKWVAYRVEPWVGDATVKLLRSSGEEAAIYSSAGDFGFSVSSRYLIIIEVPDKASTDSLKLKKSKPDDMPMEKVVLRTLNGEEERIDSVRSYKLAENADWLAYQRLRKDSTLYIRSLDGKSVFQFPVVTEYAFAKKSDRLWFVSKGDTLGAKAGVFVFDPTKQTALEIKSGKGEYKQIAFDDKGEKLAFLYCAEKDSTYKAMELWLSDSLQPARLVAERGNAAFPAKWVISEHGKLSFSSTGARLFFGTSPAPKQKDSTMLDENRPLVEVWNWDEPVQYTVQKYNKATDLKKSYQAVYNLKSDRLIQLADEELPNIQLADEGDSNIALLSTPTPYSLPSMWEGRTRSDYYAVSLETGEKKPVLKADYGRLRLSPKGEYAWWYAETDSCWYTIDLSEGKQYRLTTPQTFIAWDEENDVPDYAPAHGAAGWTTGDAALLLYDRYDIWQLDPKGMKEPVNLTVNGRKEKVSYRRLRLDEEERSINPSDTQLLRAFHEKTKGSGYYSMQMQKPAEPKALLAGEFMVKNHQKARKSNAFVYTKETFSDYPELYYTDLSFRQTTRLTNESKQQGAFKWGTAELVSWKSYEGTLLEGVVYKPTNFDPNRKYPMLVNFYERNSETLYSFPMPEPHRSTIDYAMYLSHDYIIFNPDVRYKDGYPGESCFNSIMPGISMLIDKGFVDEKAIGAQGHSWGGYQVAYLATRTNLFAAIESGAPVVNMFSAYGGIRWGSGMNRSFQYEHTQSRIAGTPWEVPLRYFENSPLFTMDKVETPILIMHNDNDGHVPWYQGIEYFVALKRLQKPVWLLNYTGEVHWPMKMANRIDFQKRMKQFFDYYLKKEPMPVWMKEGVKAVDQDFELGY